MDFQEVGLGVISALVPHDLFGSAEMRSQTVAANMKQMASTGSEPGSKLQLQRAAPRFVVAPAMAKLWEITYNGKNVYKLCSVTQQCAEKKQKKLQASKCVIQHK